MVKHKVIKEFQFLTPDKKIIVLKTNSIIEDYKLTTKDGSLEIERDIIDNNPEYFNPVDWKQELVSYMKHNKLPQPAVLSKKIIPFIEEMFVITSGSDKSSNPDMEREYKQRIKSLNDRELELEREYKSKLRELDDRERNLESKITSSEIELEREYRSKLKSLTEKEGEYDLKFQKLEKRERDINSEFDSLVKKESEIRIKTNDIREKESELANLKFELDNKERNLDKLIIESNQNLDSKQKELNDKLNEKLLEIEKKEIDIKKKMEFLKEREITLNDEYETKIKELNNSPMVKSNLSDKSVFLGYLSQVKNIQNTLSSLHNDFPWLESHTSFKDRLEKVILELKSLS